DRERRQEYGVLCVAALSGSFAPIMPNLRTKFLTVPRRWRAWLLEGARRAVADHTRATLLGAQDRQCPEQTAEEPAAEGQAVIAGNLDGRDEQGCRGRVRRLHRSLPAEIR